MTCTVFRRSSVASGLVRNLASNPYNQGNFEGCNDVFQ